MTSIPEQRPLDQPFRELPAWLSGMLHANNTDFGKRAVCLPEHANWHNTQLAGVQIRVMEFVPGPPARLVAQLRLHNHHEPLPLGSYPDLELLIQQGVLRTARGEFHAGDYLRLPNPCTNTSNGLTVQSAPGVSVDQPTLLYLAVGQMQQSDSERRQIDTTDGSLWFPGPVDGTEVQPLHGHGLGNVMLVKWTHTAAFKTRIDPRGEELLVLNGAVYDAKGYYPKNTWIRNPIPAWQAWGAKTGTLVYYKNGHFADSACPDSL